MEKLIGIYKITNPKKQVHIGQSIDIIKRFRNYYILSCKGQKLLYESLKKYGVDKHKFQIISLCKRNELDILEKYYISVYNSELNMNTGGKKYKVIISSKYKIK